MITLAIILTVILAIAIVALIAIGFGGVIIIDIGFACAAIYLVVLFVKLVCF